tara:strand:+ start:240 stop:509 length:270 start_codon:yes stop_codon:yes gene_type:complete
MLLTKFKKELKEYLPDTYEIKNSIENIKNKYSDYFMITSRKNKNYIIYVYDFIDYDENTFVANRNIIEKNFKTIFLIIDFNELKEFLFY